MTKKVITENSPRGLRYRKIPEKSVLWVVRKRKWRAPSNEIFSGLAYSTQTCRYIGDDGIVWHFAYVERKGRRKGPWLRAMEHDPHGCALSS
jgi:hypothetical protein